MRYVFKVSGYFSLTLSAWEVVKDTEKQLQLRNGRSDFRLNKRQINRVSWDGELWTNDYEQARAHLYELADKQEDELQNKLIEMRIQVAKLDEQFLKDKTNEV